MNTTAKKYLIFVLVIACVAASIALFGCAKKEEPIVESVPETTPTETKEIVIVDETEAEKETEDPYADVEERIEIDGKIRSYLTGEMVPIEIGERRPLAIMMSNDKQALPQYGINRADVVYEVPVEGVMVRYMALIEDYDDLERIGSVRSCRTYYTYFAREWDAVYAHFGQSTFAEPYLKNVDNINGLTCDGAFYRSKDKSSPHNAYSSGERINKYREQFEYRDEYDEEYEKKGGHFKFTKASEPVEFDEAISLAAAKIVPGYPYNEPWFEYDEKDGLYHRYQYGDVHKGNEGPITVKNVIFQYQPSSYYATTQYLNINVHEESYGYYFTNGRAIPLSVKKDGEFGVTHYYDAEGNEIKLNPGKTWICIIRSQDFADTEIYDKDGNRTNN